MPQIALFLFGLIIGSFLNVVIDRFPNILGRSRCNNCKKILQWHELAPLLSFLFLQGRCSKCKAKIPWQYPIIELATGLLFAWFGWSPILIFVAVLIVIFVYDWKHMLVPDLIVLPAIILAALWKPDNWLAAIIAAGFFAFLVLISREAWMGWGDVEIAALIGFLLGFPKILLALTLAFVIGSIYGIILIINKKASLKTAIPFGPFLVIATIICWRIKPYLWLSYWW